VEHEKLRILSNSCHILRHRLVIQLCNLTSVARFTEQPPGARFTETFRQWAVPVKQYVSPWPTVSCLGQEFWKSSCFIQANTCKMYTTLLCRWTRCQSNLVKAASKVLPPHTATRGSGPSSNTMFHGPGPPTVFTPNTILICSAIFAQRSRVEPCDRQTEIAIINNNRLHLMHSMQPTKYGPDATEKQHRLTASGLKEPMRLSVINSEWPRVSLNAALCINSITPASDTHRSDLCLCLIDMSIFFISTVRLSTRELCSVLMGMLTLRRIELNTV